MPRVRPGRWYPDSRIRRCGQVAGALRPSRVSLRSVGQGEPLKDKTIARIAAEHGKSVAQPILRWHIQSLAGKGLTVSPFSASNRVVADRGEWRTAAGGGPRRVAGRGGARRVAGAGWRTPGGACRGCDQPTRCRNRSSPPKNAFRGYAPAGSLCAYVEARSVRSRFPAGIPDWAASDWASNSTPAPPSRAPKA
jgi:hypothetical protein